jgi:hypothetical protein
MKTKMDLLKDAFEEGDNKLAMAIARTVTSDDVIKDLVVKGYLTSGTNCNFCNKLLADRFIGYGTCPVCYKDLASKIVSEGNKKKIQQIIDDLKLLKKWKPF